MSTLATRLVEVQERIDAAQARSSHGQSVRLVGVSKRHGVEAIEEAVRAGLTDLGENYAQELHDKRIHTTTLPIRWHFIGPVQSNKAKLVVGSTLIHTVDRLKRLRALEARGQAQSVLIQVNVAAEPQKSGVLPHELPALLDRFSDLDHLRCEGLMLIPPQGTPEQTRPHFAALRALRDHVGAICRPRVELRELSMGMSGDFEVAIEEGATLVRVGTAIFGPRPPRE